MCLCAFRFSLFSLFASSRSSGGAVTGPPRNCSGSAGGGDERAGWMNVNATAGAFQDGKLALQAVHWLNVLGNRSMLHKKSVATQRQEQHAALLRPFFLGVGLHRPV